MATMLGLENERIDFRLGSWAMKAHAKDPGELVKNFVHYPLSFLFHQIVPVAKPNRCLDQ